MTPAGEALARLVTEQPLMAFGGFVVIIAIAFALKLVASEKSSRW